jgi:hypothetical protein
VVSYLTELIITFDRTRSCQSFFSTLWYSTLFTRSGDEIAMEEQPGIAQALIVERKSKSSTKSISHYLVIFVVVVGLLCAASLLSIALLELIEEPVEEPVEGPVEQQEIGHDFLARVYINAIPKCIVRAHSP